MRFHSGLAIVLLGLGPAAAAQSPTRYHHAAGDTLVYHAQNSDSSVLATPEGPSVAVTLSESTVRLVFGTRGSARAAFTALKVQLNTAKGPVAPATDSALGRPFILTVTDRGLAQTSSAPVFSAGLSRIVDLTTEFDDFFLVLPAKPLALGVTWADTVSQSGSTAGGLKFTRKSTGTFSVVRDSTVGGRHCFVIVSSTDQTVDAVGPGPGPGRTVTNHQSGTENDLWLFDPVAGRMVARQRSGAFSGSLKVSGGGKPEEFPLTRRFVSGMELLPSGRR